MTELIKAEKQLSLSKEQILLLLNFKSIHHDLHNILDSICISLEGDIINVRKEQKELIHIIHFLYKSGINHLGLIVDEKTKHLYIAIKYENQYLFDLNMAYHPPQLGNRIVYYINKTTMNFDEIKECIKILSEQQSLNLNIHINEKEGKLTKI